MNNTTAAAIAAQAIARAAQQARWLRHTNPARARQWIARGREWQALAAHMLHGSALHDDL